MSLTIDIAGLPSERLLFAASPLAELSAMLHVLASPAHHPAHQAWASRTRASLPADLAERMAEAEFVWRSSRADFLLPGRPGATLAEELDAVDRIGDDAYTTSALVTTCGADRTLFGLPSPLHDAAVRDRALDLAQARGPLQAAFAERLIADPPMVRARVRRLLEDCGPAFFDAEWRRVRPLLVADVRRKTDLLARHGLAATLGSVSRAVSLAPGGGRIVIDKLQDNATSAVGAGAGFGAGVGGGGGRSDDPGDGHRAGDGNGNGDGMTFLPTVFGDPHLVTVHARGWRPVVQYPVAGVEPLTPVPMDQIRLRLEALSHPVRMRLVRTLARGSQTTGELALAWDLTAPEVSRHLAVLRRAGLLTTHRRGRYVLYELDAATTSALGSDLMEALLR